VADGTPHPSNLPALLVHLELESKLPAAVDRARVRGLRAANGDDVGDLVSPNFVLAAREPVELKQDTSNQNSPSPHASQSHWWTLNIDLVQTTQPIRFPYRRWQKVRMAGGVLKERGGR
jgi:hypothetical protein